MFFWLFGGARYEVTRYEGYMATRAYGNVWVLMGSRGAKNGRFRSPKHLKLERMEKKWTYFADKCFLVSWWGKHKVSGRRPYGNHWDTNVLRAGPKVVKYWAQKDKHLFPFAPIVSLFGYNVWRFLPPPLIPPSDHKYPNGSHMAFYPNFDVFPHQLTRKQDLSAK